MAASKSRSNPPASKAMPAKKTAGRKASKGSSPPDPGTSDSGEDAPSEASGQEKSDKKPSREAKSGGSVAAAEALIAEGKSAAIAQQGEALLSESANTATQAARVLSEVVAQKPQMIVGLVERFVTGITSANRRVVQTSAEALPAIAKVSPARVAKFLERLTEDFDAASEVGKDGLVRTFAALCAASVAYQKRLEPVLKKALGGADPKALVAWTTEVLPALKGEPHANARAVVEQRLNEVPRPQAQQIAEFLGVRLRPRR